MRRVTHATQPITTQKRSLYVKQSQAFDILRENSVPVSENTSSSDVSISISIDRSSLSPCIIASPSADFYPADARKFPFMYTESSLQQSSIIDPVASYISLPTSASDKLGGLVQSLWKIFKEKEAFVLETRVGTSSEGGLEIRGARFGFDDAAFRSSKRQADVHALRDISEEVPAEVEAEKDGIVLIQYDNLYFFALL